MSPRPKVDHLRKPMIVAAAAEVLYERGLFDTRIVDIAERVGTSSPTILYYFESKGRSRRRLTRPTASSMPAWPRAKPSSGARPTSSFT
ncbi:MAG: helix-turn-helix domain-containing protein [Solirubrobacteraceae bacterium]